MLELLQRFVPAADEVGRLQRGQDAEGKIFRGFCEEGHYGGRTVPTDTRQGIYAIASSGRFLASANTHSNEAMARMLEQALERYAALPVADRLLDEESAMALGEAQRLERHRPVDGLVLRVVSRDLPAEDAPAAKGWWQQAWNVDFLWFRKEEARCVLGDKPEVGARQDLALVANRLARCNLVDNVRGQTLAYRPGEVKEARLGAEVVSVSDASVELRLSGSTWAEAAGDWPRGLQTTLGGRVVWSRKDERFVAFDLVAHGRRWGRTQYNSREDDTAARPIGFVIEMAEDVPANRIAPAHIWDYGWRLR